MRWPQRFVAVCGALVLGALVVGPAVLGDTLKHKKTGEVIQGEVTQQRIGALRVFKADDGQTRFINPDEWEVVERPAPAADAPKPPAAPGAAPATPAGSPAAGAAPAAPGADGAKRVYILPILGALDDRCLVEGVTKALEEAKARKATLLVLRIDTPGGYIRLADEILVLLEKVTWARVVAWVKGDEKQALSAGALLCLAAEKIYMAPGTTIGAATPYTRTATGSPEVDEKFLSAFRARFRSLAHERGHPVVLADAMVDRTVSAVQAWMDGQVTVVTEDEARRLEKDHQGDGRFKRGKTIVHPGKVLTLTSHEAVEFGLAAGLADTQEQLLAALDHAGAEAFEAAWLPPWVRTTGQQREALVEKHRQLFIRHFDQAVTLDPRDQFYTTMGQVGSTFADGGKTWRDYTDRCLAHLQQCAVALKELEKFSKDPRYDFYLPEDVFNRMKMEMQNFFDRVKRERGLRAPPM